MATRLVFIEDIGHVTLAKRRGSRSLRLSITAAGKVRVGMPVWMSYRTGIKFAKDRKDWIAKHQAENQHPDLKNGLRIGKSHSLLLFRDTKLKTARAKVDNLNIKIFSPFVELDPRVQRKARSACERALLSEGSLLLPQRLETLSQKYGLPYNSLVVKKLTSRWGSCSSQKNITLSYFLMQLPWELIDYVILHELAHTKMLNHGPKFWELLDGMVLDAKTKQKIIRTHKPRIEPWDI